MVKIVGVVSVFNPTQAYCENVKIISQLVDHLIIMDDSDISKEEIIKQAFSEKTFYEWNGENVGLCRSINRGIKKALLLDPDWILIMDQDSHVNEEFLSSYCRVIENNDTSNVAAITPQYNYDRHKRKIKGGYCNVRFSCLSGSLLNVSLLKNIGLYDDRFYVDCLDNEWCLRAIKKGYYIIRCNESILEHHPAYTKNITAFGKVVFRYGYDKPDRYYYQFRGFLLIHDLYHDMCSDFICLYKRIKSVTLFENKKEYKEAWKQAKIDYRMGYFGKYEKSSSSES